MRCGTPKSEGRALERRDFNALRTRPARANRAADDVVADAARNAAPARAQRAPRAHREQQKGKDGSVSVSHAMPRDRAACDPFHVPGVLTRIIAAIVRPRNTSSESSRRGGASVITLVVSRLVT